MGKMRKQYLVIEVPCWNKHASANGEKLSAMLQLLKPQGIDDLDRIRLLEEYLREDAKVVYACDCCRPPGYADEENEDVPSPKPRKNRARGRRKDQHVAERCSESDPGPESEEDTPPPAHIGIDACLNILDFCCHRVLYSLPWFWIARSQRSFHMKRSRSLLGGCTQRGWSWKPT
ncbi:hypothetical protein NUW54_g9186 [Trametes sanguinea]|uniref:Uncharacterized protein n=1 Tax=Trametes sanguinea TaxID=158606 RepID=A0ACC1P940_9APHY|nr:hypothetical protein NUW54_g9186 [Trametes sanguinea]